MDGRDKWNELAAGERLRLIRQSAGRLRDRLEPIPKPPPRSFPRRLGFWKVFRTQPGCAPVIMRSGLTPKQAALIAGRMRDGESDADLDAGINYLARVKLT